MDSKRYLFRYHVKLKRYAVTEAISGVDRKRSSTPKAVLQTYEIKWYQDEKTRQHSLSVKIHTHTFAEENTSSKPQKPYVGECERVQVCGLFGR